MHDVGADLVGRIDQARSALLAEAGALSDEQGAFRPDATRWSAAQLLEHLVWAEQSGLHKMSLALDAHRRGRPVWTEANPNRERGIEEIVTDTWRPREKAPAIAEPTWGGPLSYWLAFFGGCQPVVERVAERIRPEELDEVVYPHYLSGPLTLRQRLAFIAFHIERHHAQLARLRADPDFPASA